MIRNDLADNKPLEKNMYYSQGYSKGGSTTYAWRPATATISFEPNGGTLSTTSVSGLSIDANGIVGSFTPNETYVPTLDIEGVTFLGWYMDDELTIPFDKAKVAGSLTLYAKWSKEMYKVVFNANVGTKEIDINFGNKMIIDGYYPTLPNWSTDAPLGEDKDTDTELTKKYYFVYIFFYCFTKFCQISHFISTTSNYCKRFAFK